MIYNTDKIIKGLLPVYDKLFSEFNAMGTLLEIGVLHGGALKWYRDTGRFKTIIGADINLPTAIPGVELNRVNQGNTNQLAELAAKYNGFDVVIDDGSHELEHVITTFDALWQHTRHIYVIEDWDVAYHTHRFGDWMSWLAEVWKQKRSLKAQEIRMVFNEDPNSYHGYLMLRRAV